MDSVTIDALGRQWKWPAADLDCRKVVFDTTTDLNHAYKHCRGFDTVVQAGGNMGVWPWKMAQRFKHVYTFEPDPACFPYLVDNTIGTPGLVAFNYALFSSSGTCRIVSEHGRNMGAQYIAPGSDIPTMTIDSLDLLACDLIYLDIEGAENEALLGAQQTISEFHPVVAIEDKGLSARFGTQQGHIEKWLESYGYSVVARPHRDVVLACV